MLTVAWAACLVQGSLLFTLYLAHSMQGGQATCNTGILYLIEVPRSLWVQQDVGEGRLRRHGGFALWVAC